jgi:hypothetical protein
VKSTPLRAALVTAALVTAASPSRAEEPSASASQQPRFHLGLRTGFGVPVGKYADVRNAGFVDTDVNALSDDIHGAIPLWLDAGYRLSPHLMLGGYFMFGVVLPKVAPAAAPLSGGCPDGVDCFATGVRFGVQAQYAFSPGGFVNPWMGIGLGYEWITTRLEGELFSNRIEATSSYSGPELLHVQGGVDFVLTPNLAAGPFAALSGTRYMTCTTELSGEEVDCEIEDGAWHGWLVVGVRGTLGL